MDLSIENYSINELLNIYNINENEISKYNNNYNILYNLLENKLNNKIENLKLINNSSLTENAIDNKTHLIDFFYKAFIKINNYYKNINNNDLITQDNHFLINKKENNKQEIYDSKYKSGLINPLTIKSLKKIININTRFRENYNNSLSTNFTIDLPYSLKNVLNMRLLNYELPKTVYTISSKLGSNAFFINDILICLRDGGYDAQSIIEEINNRLNEASITNIIVNYCTTSGKITFESTNNTNFTLKFDFIEENTDLITRLASNINKDQLTLGWLLGFRGNYINKKLKNPSYFNNTYTNNSFYESESIYDELGINYYLLSVNDFQNNHNNIFMSPFKQQSLADNNILAKLSSNCCSIKNINYPQRIYFGPTTINKLHIKIYDEFGRIIDVNNADLSIELECELLYDL
jgi:hypothetical protein